MHRICIILQKFLCEGGKPKNHGLGGENHGQAPKISAKIFFHQKYLIKTLCTIIISLNKNLLAKLFWPNNSRPQKKNFFFFCKQWPKKFRVGKKFRKKKKKFSAKKLTAKRQEKKSVWP